MLYAVGETAKKPGRVTYTRAATRKRNTKNTKKTSKIKIILICIGERIPYILRYMFAYVGRSVTYSDILSKI